MTEKERSFLNFYLPVKTSLALIRRFSRWTPRLEFIPSGNNINDIIVLGTELGTTETKLGVVSYNEVNYQKLLSNVPGLPG